MTIECSRLVIERYHGKELPPEQTAAVKEHLENCSLCSEYCNRLKNEQKIFLSEHPFRSFSRIHAPLVELPWYRKILAATTKPALMPIYATLLVVAVVFPVVNYQHQNKMSEIRFKGKQPISFLYERNGKVYSGVPSEIYHANDKIQVLYHLEKNRYVSLLSIDTRGTVSFYDPASGNNPDRCSVYSEAGANIKFPGSIILDNSSGHELVLTLFSDSALSRTAVEQWIKKLYSTTPDPIEINNYLKHHFPGIEAEVITLLLQKG